jgi:integrase/recombinase XerD
MAESDNRRISAFLEAQAAEQGAARNTLLAYGRDLSDASASLTQAGHSLASADRSAIETYLAGLDALGLSAATRARRLSALKQFYRFAHDEGWRADNPVLQIKGPTRARALPGTLDMAEVDALLAAAAAHGKTPADRARNACLMQILYACGLRVSELVALPVAAVRGNPQVILVRGKGGKDRMVPLSTPARAAITAWLGHRDAAEQLARQEKGAKPSAFLFPSRAKAGHLTRIRFFMLIKDWALAAGLSPERVTPHTLRHAFATHLLHNGADLRVIQMLLGHADIATTEIYTHILDERLKTLVFEHHPLAQR